MKNTAQNGSTQTFTEIVDIRDDIVLLKGNTACIVLKVTSVNFALLSGQEQDSKVYAYAALLNSLSFPIQILVRSKPLRIEPYIASIDSIARKTQNPSLRTYITKYKDFVESLVQMSTVLDKQFFIVIPYSVLESGVSSLIHTASTKDTTDFFEEAQANLETKAESLLAQIHRLSLQAKILKKNELVKLFYEIYNPDGALSLHEEDIENPIVKANI